MDRVRPHQDRDADDARADAGELEPARLLVRREQMRDDDAEERGRGIDDRGEAAGDLGLAPEDQAERDQVVEQAHAEEGEPHPPADTHR